MYFRTFFFLLFISSVLVFFFSSFEPNYTLHICGSMCKEDLSLSYIQLTSMFASAISLMFLVLTNYYAEKKIKKDKERLASDRLNIEKIHAELEALKA